MKKEDFEKLTKEMKNQRVERPNKASAGTLSGHAAGEPFEKCVYKILKAKYQITFSNNMNISTIYT
ncbi:UNVERIFIED_CONTAM: HincII family type II restriction endonuclease [Prevotella sp. 15_C9]